MFSGFVRYLEQHVVPVLTGAISAFFGSLVSDIEKSGSDFLTDAATAAVAAAEATGASGSTKFAAALASVKASLTTEGLPIIENAVQGAILAAVANLNASHASAPVTDV